MYKNNSRCQIVYIKGKVLLFYLLGILIFFFVDNVMLVVGCEDGYIYIFYVYDEGQIYRKNNIIFRVSIYKLYSYIEFLRFIGFLLYLVYNFCCFVILRDI